MAEEKKYSVIFNDHYSHDGAFKAGQYADLTEEQYKCAKSLGCGFDSTKPLITDVTKTTDIKKEIK
jgi:hypothetical protein